MTDSTPQDSRAAPPSPLSDPLRVVRKRLAALEKAVSKGSVQQASFRPEAAR